MTRYQKYWEDMKKYCQKTAESYRKKSDSTMVHLYMKWASDVQFMIDHEQDFSEDIKW